MLTIGELAKQPEAAEDVPLDTLLSTETAPYVSGEAGDPVLVLKAKWPRQVLNGRIVPPF